MTEIDELIKLFGSYRKLAAVLGVSHGMLRHWKEKGLHRIPAMHNAALSMYARDNFSTEERKIVERCLEQACPLCGRPY